MSNQDELFAVVHFTVDPSLPENKCFAVIRYSWVTEAGNKFVGPPYEYVPFELQALINDVVPKPDWIEYDCLVLKYDIGTIKAANIERDIFIRKETDESIRQDAACSNLSDVEIELSKILYCLERMEEMMKIIKEFIEKSPQSKT